MINQLKYALIYGVIALNTANAETIFHEDFDGLPDWHPPAEVEGCNDPSCAANMPAAWNYYRVDELWHPNTDGAGFHPSIQVSGTNFHGPSGKGFTVYNESNVGRGGDGWGSDGILAKDLGKDYDEIYVGVHIKFMPGFKWHIYDNGQGSAVKLLRFYHWDRQGSPFKYFTSGHSAPIYIFDAAKSPYGFRQIHSFRCDPQETNYYCTHGKDSGSVYDGAPTFEQLMGDNGWHYLEWRAKMNSAPGAKDGILEFWVDGKLQFSRQDQQWLGESSPGGIGWNTVAIGGNAYNQYAPPEEQKEQWYAFDNLKVSTTREGIISPPMAPSDPTID